MTTTEYNASVAAMPTAPSGTTAPPPLPPHAQGIEQVARALGTDATAGLTTAVAKQRLAEYGPNELAQAPPEPWWRRLGRQFADLLIWVLIAAAVI